MAGRVLDTRWLLLYAAVFAYAAWDSHRSAVDLNKLSILAERGKSPIVPLRMDAFEINYLAGKTPWITVAWSLLTPGLGHLYAHRLPAGFFILAWWVVINYYSHFSQSFLYTFLGAFAQATASANPQWLLFMPSLYGFAIYDSYANASEQNKLLARELLEYLTDNYHNTGFAMPV